MIIQIIAVKLMVHFVNLNWKMIKFIILFVSNNMNGILVELKILFN